MTPGAEPASILPGSFRDPHGRTYLEAARVSRHVTEDGWPDLFAFLKSPLSQALEQSGRLVSTTIVSAVGPIYKLEHEKIPFPSYPFEWPAEMLLEAGRLTLNLARAGAGCGFGLKDASPSNVLFRGASPVFVDVLSFERRDQGDPIWLPYAQFVRNFHLPLLLDRRFGVPLRGTFLSNRDGVEPEYVYSVAGPLQRWQPPLLTLSTLPALLGRLKSPAPHRSRQVGVEAARYSLNRLYNGLEKQLLRIERIPPRGSAWSSYEKTCPYSLRQVFEKRKFVESVFGRLRPKRLLDVGCNTGTFSLLGAQAGADVVAIDSDPIVVGETWRRAREKRAGVLPLAVDIARPTPAVGWRNLESLSFLARACGYFDCQR